MRVGVTQGSVVAGSLGSAQPCCQFFGGAAEEAGRLLRDGRPGEIRVQRRLARSQTATESFTFAPVPPAVGGMGVAQVLVLLGRRVGGGSSGQWMEF